MQWTAEEMIMLNAIIDASAIISHAEKSPLFRYGTLLPNDPVSCIVVLTRGVWRFPEPTISIRILLSTGLTPPSLSHAARSL
jgi:hypothetical protein